MKKFFQKIAQWYKNQTPTTQGLIWFGVILIIGIIIRWDYIIEHIGRGFQFYSTK